MQQILVFTVVALVAVQQADAACPKKPTTVTGVSLGPALGGVCPSGYTCYANGAQGDQCYPAAATKCPNKPATVTGQSIGAAIGGTCPTGYTCYTNGAQGAQCFPAVATKCPNKPATVTGKSIGAAIGGTCPTGYTCYTNGAQGAECFPPAVAVCRDNNSQCAQWVQNGFCSNTAYSIADKQSYCAKTCALC